MYKRVAPTLPDTVTLLPLQMLLQRHCVVCNHTAWCRLWHAPSHIVKVWGCINQTELCLLDLSATHPQVQTKHCMAQYGNLANYWACTENSRLWPWTKPEDNSASKTMTSSPVLEYRSRCSQEMATDHLIVLLDPAELDRGSLNVSSFVVGVLSTRLYRWRRSLWKESYSAVLILSLVIVCTWGVFPE